MAYSLAQLQGFLRQAGCPDVIVSGRPVIAVMASLALAESGGNARAHNPKPPDDSYGLWQVNMLGRLGPERRGQFGIARNEDLYDPLTNAKAAISIYRAQGLKAWSTYLYGQYKTTGKYTQSLAVYSGGGGNSSIDYGQVSGEAGGLIDRAVQAAQQQVNASQSGNGGQLVTVGAAFVAVIFVIGLIKS